MMFSCQLFLCVFCVLLVLSLYPNMNIYEPNFVVLLPEAKRVRHCSFVPEHNRG